MVMRKSVPAKQRSSHKWHHRGDNCTTNRIYSSNNLPVCTAVELLCLKRNVDYVWIIMHSYKSVWFSCLTTSMVSQKTTREILTRSALPREYWKFTQFLQINNPGRESQIAHIEQILFLDSSLCLACQVPVLSMVTMITGFHASYQDTTHAYGNTAQTLE